MTAQSTRCSDADGTGFTAYRRLFAEMADAECLALGARLVAALHEELRSAVPPEADQDPATDLQRLRHQAATWTAKDADRYRSVLAEISGGDARLAAARRAMLGCAPLALRSGAWLQWLSSPADADDPVVLAILAAYASDVGVGRPRQSRGDVFLSAMRELDLADYATPVERLAAEDFTADHAFRIPAVLIAMGRRPDVFRAELLGADECLRTVGLLPALRLVRDVMPRLVDWSALDLSRTRLHAPDPDSSAAPPIPYPVADEPRVAAGYRWALHALESWSCRLRGELAASADPAHEMAELIRLRGRQARLYHHEFRLGGRSLADLMTEGCTDPEPLLNALASSRLVRPGRPERSPLLGSLIAESGPMFRVFSPHDIAVIRRWITSLPPEGAGAVSASAATDAQGDVCGAPAALDAALGEPTQPDQRPSGLRDAYRMLQPRTQGPQVRAFAWAYARDWLDGAERELDRANVLPPQRWSVRGLKDWLAAQHERHAMELDAASKELPERDQLINSTVQLAPLILLDGSWLRGFTDYSHASTEVGYSLFATYWDELGNGLADLNHPLIYRRLLNEMGVRLPPTASAQFADWPGFRETSFELPVFWLSLGSFPRTLLAETLGLNLAMELSGVGGGYRKAAAALRAYGFSTRFVDIHNTIDNVVTGHSAWAADAINAYLAEMARSHGTAAQEQAWSRVRVGFHSLTAPQRGRRRRLRGTRSAASRRPGSASTGVVIV